MAKTQVNIKPVYVIEQNLGIQPKGPVHAFFTERVATHSDKYVPARDLNLATSERHTVDEIRYGGASIKYAHYMWEGKVMGPNIPIKDKNGNIIRWISKGPKYYTGEDIEYSKEKHEKATSHWVEKMWTAEKDDILKEVADFIKKRG